MVELNPVGEIPQGNLILGQRFKMHYGGSNLGPEASDGQPSMASRKGNSHITQKNELPPETKVTVGTEKKAGHSTDPRLFEHYLVVLRANRKLTAMKA